MNILFKYNLLAISFYLLTVCSGCNDLANKKNATPQVRLASDPFFHWKQDTLLHKEDRYSGRTYTLYASGDTASVDTYSQGVLDGRSSKWYEDGSLMEERFYKQGKKEGVHRGYWQNNRPRFEYYFVRGEHEGPLSEWYENGQLFKQMHFINGYEEGSQRLWWENGGIRANYVVKNGRRYGLIGLKLCSNPDSSAIK